MQHLLPKYPDRNDTIEAEARKVVGVLPRKFFGSGFIPRNTSWAINSHGNVVMLERNGMPQDTGIKIGRKAVKF